MGGLLRVTRPAGGTVHVVAGALTVYLVVGLLFASILASAATVETSPHLMQGEQASNGERVYYSFTVPTMIGFGDVTAAGRCPRRARDPRGPAVPWAGTRLAT